MTKKTNLAPSNRQAMNATETTTKTALEGYSIRELAIILARYRGRRIPRRTLNYWINQLCLSPNEYGEYSPKDVELLIRLISWLSRGLTINAFWNKYQQEIEEHAS